MCGGGGVVCGVVVLCVLTPLTRGQAAPQSARTSRRQARERGPQVGYYTGGGLLYRGEGGGGGSVWGGGPPDPPDTGTGRPPVSQDLPETGPGEGPPGRLLYRG